MTKVSQLMDIPNRSRAPMATAPVRAQTASQRRLRRLTAIWPILAITVAFGLGWAGGSILPSAARSARLSIGQEIMGVVSIANHDGSKVCITPDGDRQQRCSVVYQLVGSAPLKVGDHVQIAVGSIRHGNISDEVFIVTGRPGTGL